jgi:hypothetical protein
MGQLPSHYSCYDHLKVAVIVIQDEVVVYVNSEMQALFDIQLLRLFKSRSQCAAGVCCDRPSQSLCVGARRDGENLYRRPRPGHRRRKARTNFRAIFYYASARVRPWARSGCASGLGPPWRGAGIAGDTARSQVRARALATRLALGRHNCLVRPAPGKEERNRPIRHVDPESVVVCRVSRGRRNRERR